MCNEVGAGGQQGARIGQTVQVHRHTLPASMCFVDDGAIDLGRHLLGSAKVVVDADLHDVHATRHHISHLLPRLRSGGGRKDRSGQENTRMRRWCGLLCTPRRKDRGCFIAERKDRGDAVGRIGGEVRHRRRVAVRVDQPRHDDFAGERYTLGVGGNPYARGCTGRNHAPIANEQCGVAHGAGRRRLPANTRDRAGARRVPVSAHVWGQPTHEFAGIDAAHDALGFF